MILSRKNVAFRIVVVGGFERESYRQEIAKRLHEAKLAEQFELVGYQGELLPFLNRASIYCCPSHTEGMSRVIVEAMAAGLPVVSTDCGGPRDLVEEDKTGFLVPVKDPEALAAALTRMLADPARRVSMGEAGRWRALDLFDLKSTVPQLAGILEEAAHSPPASQAKPLAQLLLTLLEVGGPRVLLGKKWRLLKPLIR
jgi:glycosyltransferase involved in cell wall biosynthesis